MYNSSQQWVLELSRANCQIALEWGAPVFLAFVGNKTESWKVLCRDLSGWLQLVFLWGDVCCSSRQLVRCTDAEAKGQTALTRASANRWHPKILKSRSCYLYSQQHSGYHETPNNIFPCSGHAQLMVMPTLILADEDSLAEVMKLHPLTFPLHNSLKAEKASGSVQLCQPLSFRPSLSKHPWSFLDHNDHCCSLPLMGAWPTLSCLDCLAEDQHTQLLPCKDTTCGLIY